VSDRGVERLRRLAAVVAERDTYKNALERIAACPNPNSVDDCHDLMSDIATHALASSSRPEGRA
jgi:hypothetical protein